MKILNTPWRLLVLIPLVIIVIVLTERRTGANAAGNQEVREAAIVAHGGITHGQTLRFSVARLATVVGGPPIINAHSGGCNLELTVFDSQGNVVASHQFPEPSQNVNGGVWKTSFFDLNADQLPQDKFDVAGRAQLIGVLNALTFNGDVNNPNGGFVAKAEVFDNNNTGKTLTWWAFEPLFHCGKAGK